MPAALRAKALAEGAECAQWLGDLGPLVDDLEQAWRVDIGEAVDGGTASLVAFASRADGTPVVVKLAMPATVDGWDALDREASVLRSAAGNGCVRLLEHDQERHALMLERLGPPLADLGLPLAMQLRVVARTLQDLWAVPADPNLPSGADKARWLAGLIVDTWALLDRPCAPGVVEYAVALADKRASDFDPGRAVLAHGDGHAWNTLQDPATPQGFRFVDPDGLYVEAEYDLAISMREYNDELLRDDSYRAGRDRARLLADLTGTDAQRIWEWGYLERVSTGLLLIKIDKNPALGRTILAIAEDWMNR